MGAEITLFQITLNPKVQFFMGFNPKSHFERVNPNFKKWNAKIPYCLTPLIFHFKVLWAEWYCPLLEMVVKWGVQCCPLVIIDVELCIRSILIGRYLNSSIRLVFSIKLLKCLPKLLVGPTRPMATTSNPGF